MGSEGLGEAWGGDTLLFWGLWGESELPGGFWGGLGGMECFDDK